MSVKEIELATMSALSSHSISLLAIISITTFLFSLLIRKGRSERSSALPPLVKYSIPWLGNALEYRKGPANFFRACREQYGSIFRVYLGGRYVVVVSSPTGIHNALWRPQGIDVFQFQLIHKISGVADHKAEYIFEVTKPVLRTAARQLSKRRLGVPGTIFALDLLERLRTSTHNVPRVHQLSNFIRNNIYPSVSITFWGPLLPIDASMIDDFMLMDAGMDGILAGMLWSSRAARRARTRLTQRFVEYVRLAWRDEDQTLDGASTLMSETVSLYKKENLSEEEVARLLLTIHWGTLANLMNGTFWLWTYLLADKPAFSRVKDEIERVVVTKFGDVDSLLQMGPPALEDPCFATLNSAIRETLRMILLPTSVRQATTDTSLVVDGGREYQLRKGDLIILDVRNMHMDDAAFPDSGTFKVDRFIDKETLRSQQWKQMSMSREFVPFGGGEHICRGREFALHALRAMVIICVSLFDVSPVQCKGEEMKVPDFRGGDLVSTIRPLSDIQISLVPK